MTDRKKAGVAFWATVVVVVGLIPSTLYLLAYAWIVEPKAVVTFPSAGGEHHFVVPDYHRLGDSMFWRTFFRPANELDRHIRPDTWQPE